MALQAYAFAEVASLWNRNCYVNYATINRLSLLQFQSDGSKQEDKEKMVSLFWRKVFLCEMVIDAKCLITVQHFFLCRVLRFNKCQMHVIDFFFNQHVWASHMGFFSIFMSFLKKINK